MTAEASTLLQILFFPCGLCLVLLGFLYEFLDRKLLARFQNRQGPRWFQPVADFFKLLAKEEVVPQGVNPFFFWLCPVVACAGALTAALYVPVFGLAPVYSMPGDLVIVFFLLGLMTICMGLAGANTPYRFSLLGAVRTLTQLFSFEAPLLLALLGPAILAGSWQISEIEAYARANPWMMFSQLIGFIVAIIGLMGKLELPPFDAPEAESEIVAGALTEYSGRGLALFHLGENIEFILGIAIIAALYMGGFANPVDFALKSLSILIVIVALQALFARFRIDQTVGLWWRIGALLALMNLLLVILVKMGSFTPLIEYLRGVFS